MDPGHIIVDFFARHKEGKVLQPFPALLAKASEVPTVGLACVCKKSASRFAKEFLFEGDDSTVRHMLVRKIGCRGEILRREKSFLTKSFQIDEQRVSGKCRETLVWTIAVSGAV